MAVYIVVENSFSRSTWTKNIVISLSENLIRNGIKHETLEYITTFNNTENNYAFIVGGNKYWVQKKIVFCKENNIYPIVLNSSSDFVNYCSNIDFDYYSNLQELSIYLKTKNKSKPALYAVNPESNPNNIIKNYFCEIFHCNNNNIFYNHCSLRNCFDDFYEKIDNYDTIICVNAYAAIHLINELKKRQYPIKNILFVSYGDAFILSKILSDITIITQNHKAYGKIAANFLKFLFDNPSITNLTVGVKCSIYESGKLLESYMPTIDKEFSHDSLDKFDFFYDDPDIKEINTVENMLSECKQLDLEIINLMLLDLSYDHIADICFTSTNTIKYHAKKLISSCGCKSKREFKNIISKYLSS